MTPDLIGCPEAEAALLGALLWLPTTEAAPVLERVAEDDLVDPRNRVVIEAVRRVVDDGVRPDPTAVLGELRRAGELSCFTADRSAGTFLADLLAATPLPQNVGTYARTVLEHSARRRLTEAAERLAQAAGQSALTDLTTMVVEESLAVLERLDEVLPQTPMGKLRQLRARAIALGLIPDEAVA